MITSVLFDMGGTLEDIYVDAQSEWAAIDRLRDMLDLPQVQIDSGSYVLHCTEPGIAPLTDYIGQSPFLIIGDADTEGQG